MSIALGARSVARLAGVHPDLVRFVRRTTQMAIAEVDSTVLESVRSDKQAYIDFGKGRRHRTRPAEVSHGWSPCLSIGG